MITLTEKAATQIKKIMQENEAENMHLRMLIESGGCSGFQYGMGVDTPQAGDHQFETSGVRITIDPKSFPYLQGCTVDFDDGLNGRGFQVKNPNAKSSCGCGKSFHNHD